MHQYGLVVTGAACIALGLEFCYIPYHLIDGGMTGLAVVIGRSTGIRPADVLLVLNSTCLAVGVRTLGLRFVARAAVGLVTLWMLLSGLGPFPPVLAPPVAALLGGAGVGLGVGLIILAGSGLDGCEVLGQVCLAAFRLPVFWFQLAFNVGVMGLVASRFGLPAAALSIVAQAAGQVILFWLLPTGRRSRG